MKASGCFTLPGEAGYEQLTLELAKRWGADAVRDCEGTSLSNEILEAGFDIYSTICIIRNHNEFARKHPHVQQQTFLMSKAVLSEGESMCIPLLDGFFDQQFAVNDDKEALAYYQVFDRTTNQEIPRDVWEYHKENGTVVINHAIPWHRYTVNFLAWRIWEEINMYNHVTNNWKSEHLMQLDPRYPEVQAFLRSYLEEWCLDHPHTDVVRFTSLFYNFVWIWGSDGKNRDLFSDWASYDFTVSPKALQDFSATYGYALCSEDFINQGRRNPNHITWNRKMKDYLSFTNDFVVGFAKELVAIVHSHKKQAYVFYDDSWVGMEPGGKRFSEIGFDGIIKCVFSGFEARLCASVESTPVHELRLHPYLFPVGLGGAPTFAPGGNPALDATTYWSKVRRALLRKSVDRIGLGGYLHLTTPFPDFIDAVDVIADEFRTIKELHTKGAPLCFSLKLLVLTDWGSLRSWTCGGHYHEHPDLDLINIVESLSGLPFDVEFETFDNLTKERLQQVAVVINAGFAGSSYSGGDAWCNDTLVENLTQWVHEGGVFLGVNEPSEVKGYDTLFRMAHILGVDRDDGRRLCHGRWPCETDGLGIVGKCSILEKQDIYLLDEKTKVLTSNNNSPCITCRDVTKGKGVYLSSYRVTAENTRMLQNLILYACNQLHDQFFTSDNAYVEGTWFPASKQLVVLNSSEIEQQAEICCENMSRIVQLKPFEMHIIQMN